ncbi:MAG TPA: hypothetical protein VHC19_19980 [Pirellulales bacterium]|nr:hypothetical protein [Pirellulales bacterium]
MSRKRNLAQEQEQPLEPHQPSGTTPPPVQESQHEHASPLRPWKLDNVAGVERLNYIDAGKEIFEFWIRFRDGKPSGKVRQYMKDNGFHWEPDAPKGGQWPEADGAWVRPLGLATKSQDRLHGERVFEKVAEMLREEKGIAAGQLQDEGIGF